MVFLGMIGDREQVGHDLPSACEAPGESDFLQLGPRLTGARSVTVIRPPAGIQAPMPTPVWPAPAVKSRCCTLAVELRNAEPRPLRERESAWTPRNTGASSRVTSRIAVAPTGT